jgi:hypothetical protein
MGLDAMVVWYVWLVDVLLGINWVEPGNSSRDDQNSNA